MTALSRSILVNTQTEVGTPIFNLYGVERVGFLVWSGGYEGGGKMKEMQGIGS